jgi:hypothetical protein
LELSEQDFARKNRALSTPTSQALQDCCKSVELSCSFLSKILRGKILLSTVAPQAARLLQKKTLNWIVAFSARFCREESRCLLRHHKLYKILEKTLICIVELLIKTFLAGKNNIAIYCEIINRRLLQKNWTGL